MGGLNIVECPKGTKGPIGGGKYAYTIEGCVPDPIDLGALAGGSRTRFLGSHARLTLAEEMPSGFVETAEPPALNRKRIIGIGLAVLAGLLILLLLKRRKKRTT